MTFISKIKCGRFSISFESAKLNVHPILHFIFSWVYIDLKHLKKLRRCYELRNCFLEMTDFINYKYKNCHQCRELLSP